MKDKDFKNQDIALCNGLKIATQGTIIGEDQYKPDISISDLANKTVCCIESSSTGDRKVSLGEMLQAEKYALDMDLSLLLIICLCGKGKNASTPESLFNYLKPYFIFLKESRRKTNSGIKKILIIGEKNYEDYISSGQNIFKPTFENKCKVLE